MSPPPRAWGGQACPRRALVAPPVAAAAARRRLEAPAGARTDAASVPTLDAHGPRADHPVSGGGAPDRRVRVILRRATVGDHGARLSQSAHVDVPRLERAQSVERARRVGGGAPPGSSSARDLCFRLAFSTRASSCPQNGSHARRRFRESSTASKSSASASSRAYASAAPRGGPPRFALQPSCDGCGGRLYVVPAPPRREPRVPLAHLYPRPVRSDGQLHRVFARAVVSGERRNPSFP